MSYSVEQGNAIRNIERAVASYCRGLDRLDVAWIQLAYWPDAVDERFDGSIDQFAERAVRTHETFEWTMHLLHNHLIEFDSRERARGELYVVAHLMSADPPKLNTFFGRYLDVYERRGDDWRIRRRACVHEGSQSVAATPTLWSFATQRPGSIDRPTSSSSIGP